MIPYCKVKSVKQEIRTDCPRPSITCEDKACRLCTGKDPGSGGGHPTSAGDVPTGAAGSAPSPEELQENVTAQNCTFAEIARGAAASAANKFFCIWFLAI
jgi:hypothetical protein